MIVGLQNERNLSTVVGNAGLQKAQRGRIGITAGLDGQLEVIARVIPGGIGGKTAGRAVLKALVHWQNHHLARAGQTAMIKHTRQIGAYTRIFASIPAKDFTNTIVHLVSFLLHSSLSDLTTT